MEFFCSGAGLDKIVGPGKWFVGAFLLLTSIPPLFLLSTTTPCPTLIPRVPHSGSVRLPSAWEIPLCGLLWPSSAHPLTSDLLVLCLLPLTLIEHLVQGQIRALFRLKLAQFLVSSLRKRNPELWIQKHMWERILLTWKKITTNHKFWKVDKHHKCCKFQNTAWHFYYLTFLRHPIIFLPHILCLRTLFFFNWRLCTLWSPLHFIKRRRDRSVTPLAWVHPSLLGNTGSWDTEMLL